MVTPTLQVTTRVIDLFPYTQALRASHLLWDIQTLLPYSRASGEAGLKSGASGYSMGPRRSHTCRNQVFPHGAFKTKEQSISKKKKSTGKHFEVKLPIYLSFESQTSLQIPARQPYCSWLCRAPHKQVPALCLD